VRRAIEDIDLDDTALGCRSVGSILNHCNRSISSDYCWLIIGRSIENG
jgi:hypothetical protein